MLYINEDKLKNLLLNKKEKIASNKFYGIGEIISGISLIISLLCSDFKDVLGIKAEYIEIFAWLIAGIILFFGIFQLIKGFIHSYTTDDLYNDLVELGNTKPHMFNIILLKNNPVEGKYLLFYNKRWQCKLFLNYKAITPDNYNSTAEIKNICSMFSTDTGISVAEKDFAYLGQIESHKLSYGDKTEKDYIFHFYKIDISVPISIQQTSFKCNGHQFHWMSLNQMYGNINIVKKNKDVLDFIRTRTSIS